MKEIFIVLSLVFPLLGIGQVDWELARINDADGYVNIRSAKGVNSEIKGVIEEGKFFLCEPTNKSWWKVNNLYSLTGFVHKSRITLIKDLSDQEQLELIEYSMEVLRNNRNRYDSLRLMITNEERMDLVRELEKFEDTNYTPLNSFIAKLFCKRKNVNLLQEFLKTMVINSKSANETPAWTLGDCYLCYADLVLKEINKFKGSNREYLLDMLEFGFENVTGGKEADIENYEELKNKLNN